MLEKGDMFAFHGADSKVGCTMIAQCAAEVLADELSSEKILLISLNGDLGDNYMYGESISIAEFKMQLDSGVGVDLSRLRPRGKNSNLYFIAGIGDEPDERYYFPQTAESLLNAVCDSFRIIIADTGSRLDNGLAFGGLGISRANYLIFDQSESCLRRFERNRKMYENAGIFFDKYIINKFSNREPYTMRYISQRLKAENETVMKAEFSGHGRTADMEMKSLMEFEADKFVKDVQVLVNDMLKTAGLPLIGKKRKGHGKILFGQLHKKCETLRDGKAGEGTH